MSDETIQYITTDYLIEVDGGDPTPAPIEYIVELGQVGVQGVPGEKGEPGFTPTVSYILNNNTFEINIVNQDGVTQTPNLYDYFADKNGYLKVDGSNAEQDITINQARFTSLSNNSGVRIGNKNGRGTLQLSQNTTYLQTGTYGLIANYADQLVSFGNVNGTAKVIQATADKVYYEAYSSSPSNSDNEIATIGDIGNGTITITQGGVTKGTFTTNQSGNTTIDLDAGGGSITNPLVIQNTDEDRKLYFGINSSNQLYMRYDLIYNSGGGQITIPYNINLIAASTNPINISDYISGLKLISLNYNTNTLELDANNYLNVKGMVGADGTNAGSAGLVPAPTATDNTKFLRGDGTWQTVGGGSSYTEGTGIDITNDVISIDTSVVAQLSDIPDVSNFVTNSSLATTLASYVQSSSLATVATTGNYTDLNGRPNLNAYVTLDTTQTISGTKTFQDASLVHVSGSNTYNVFQRNVFGNIQIGNANDGLLMFGSGIRPSYNTNSLALYSDIPTVPTNISAFTNDSGYITNSALSGYATETWVGSQGYLTSSDISDMATKTWVGQQGYITGISSTDVVNALGYTPYSNSNPSGYTSNVGTVTSVNNTQPDANGNVTINLTPTVIDGGNA